MYKLCKTEQSASRQRQLEEGLMAIMKTKRYEEITISELCDSMGVPRKSFYRYFSGKDGALHALIDHTLLDYEHQLELHPAGANRDAHGDLRQFFEFWQRNRTLLDVLERSAISGILVQRAISQAQNEAMIVGYPANPELRATQNHAVNFAICGLMSMMLRWHRSGAKESPGEMAKIATQILSNPLVSLQEIKK